MRDYRPQAEKSRFEKVLQTFAQTPLGGKLFITVFPAIDRRLMPLTRGKLSTGLGQPIVLLHARGARTGVERTTPLLATKTGEQILVVASKAGRPEASGLVPQRPRQPGGRGDGRRPSPAGARPDRAGAGARAAVGDRLRQLLGLRDLSAPGRRAARSRSWCWSRAEGGNAAAPGNIERSWRRRPAQRSSASIRSVTA